MDTRRSTGLTNNSPGGLRANGVRRLTTATELWFSTEHRKASRRHWRRGGRALGDACRSQSQTSRPRPADLLAAAANKRSEQTAPSFFSRTTGCHSHQTLSTVVSESRCSPAGRKPLSISSSHSWPNRPFSSTAVVRPAAGPALSIGVLRQNRCCWYSGGTCDTRTSIVKTLPKL